MTWDHTAVVLGGLEERHWPVQAATAIESLLVHGPSGPYHTAVDFG